MRVTLSSAGNPDHGQYYGENLLSPTLLVEVEDFAEVGVNRTQSGNGCWSP